MNLMTEAARYAYGIGLTASGLLLITIIIRALFGDYSVDTVIIGLLAGTVMLQSFNALLTTSSDQ